MTVAQDWARKRNFAYYSLKGIVRRLSCLENNMEICSGESLLIKYAVGSLKDVLIDWKRVNEESKRRYIKRNDENK